MTEIIYALIYIIPMLLTGASGFICRYYALEEGDGTLPIVIMLVLGILLTILGKVSIKQRIIIAGSLGALVLGAILVSRTDSFNEWLSENLWIWMTLVIALAIAALGLMMLKLRAVKLAVGILLLGLLLSSYWTRLIDDRISLVCIILFETVTIFEQLRLTKRGEEQLSLFVVRVAPVLAVGVIALSLLPFSEKPYDWAFAKAAIERISDGITTLRQRFEDEDSAGEMEASFGLSDKDNFYGSISGEPREMIRLLMDRQTPEYLYLDGNYFDTFDGRRWTRSENTYPYLMDGLELRVVSELINPEELKDYRRLATLRLTYKNMNSVYVFAPLKTLRNDKKGRKEEILYDNQELRFTHKAGNKTEYELSYAIINRNEETLPVLIEAAGQIDKELWDSIRNKEGLTDEVYSYEAFGEYRAMLNSYCFPKEELSEGVRAFLDCAVNGRPLSENESEEITGLSMGQEEGISWSEYDRLKNLAAALSTLEYTYSPGTIPGEVDSASSFLDYFLLESKKGYCNYFATAFVLLSRAEGIPARYVHGYRIPRNSHGEVSVMNTMAHAYPEAYIEGIGWMVFEPTPSYEVGQAWDALGVPIRGGTVNMPTGIENMQEDFAELEELGEAIEEPTIEWYRIVVPVVFGLIALVILAIILRVVNARAYRALSNEQKVRTICHRFLILLNHLGYAKADYESLREYSNRVQEQSELRLEMFTVLFERVMYSAKDISDSEISALEAEYQELADTLKGTDRLYYLLVSFVGR